MYISSHQSAQRTRPIRYLLISVAIALGYFLLGHSTIQLGTPATFSTFIWPPAGFALAVLILGGARMLPGLLFGVVATQYSAGLPSAAALLVGAGALAGAVAGYYILKRYLRFEPAMTRLRDLMGMVLVGAIFSPLLSASLGSLGLKLFGVVQGPALYVTWLQWWMGDALGIILLTPAVLACFHYEPIRWTKARVLEAVALAGMLLGLCFLAFNDLLSQAGELEAKAFLVFPLVIWAALSFHQRGAAVASMLIVMTALWGGGGYHGYFSMEISNAALFNYWMFALVTVSIGVGLSGLHVGRLHADEQLRRQLGLYNALSNAQSDAGEGVVVIEDGKIIYANEALWKIGGYDARDIPMGSSFLSLIHPSDRERVAQHYAQRIRGEYTPSRYEAMAISKSGKSIPIEVAAANYRDGSERVVVLIIDISSRKQAEEALLQSRAEYRELVESVKAVVWRATPDAAFTFVSQEAESLLGYPIQEWTGNPGFWAETMHPDDREWVVDFCAWETQQLKDHVFEYRMLAADGRVVWLQDIVRVIPDRFGKPQELLGVMLDITARKAAEASLKLSKQVFDNTSEAILIADRDLNILEVNQAYLDMTGCERGDCIGVRLSLLDEPGDGGQTIGSLVQQDGKWMGELLAHKKSGEYYPEWVSISTVHDSNGILQNYVVVLTDISQRKQSEERLQFLATHDGLTGLPNRALLQERTELALLRAQRYQQRIGVLFIDLDRFKIINDTLGHQAGDMLLQEAASRLRECLRQTDTIARQGGDEFVVLVEDFTEQQYLAGVARKIMHALAQPFILMQQELYISASIGISVYPEDGVDIFSLLKNADMAMYRAKDDGKNTFHFYSAESNASSVSRLTLENSLRRALERNEFTLLYQAKLDLAEQGIIGAEALIRWHSAELGLVSPQDFIPIAEETGLIIEIGEWVLQQACRDACRWQAIAGRPVRVGVNISARQFREDSLHKAISNALEESGLTPDCLELEITESMIMQNAERASQMLQHFRDLGSHVLIDDFGTGYSSLGYLKHFPIDSLKIDRSFVRDIPQDSDDMAITQAIIAMAHSLKINVVAEGVETQAQLEFLRGQGCDQLQGYIFSRPLAGEDFLGMLRFDTARRAGRTHIRGLQLEEPGLAEA
ncbi:EAL domain-containing protein [Methylobacillus flagellatus]|uniref:bifunctional diguanylate cyclase/phosphodiesterase n=1 Tax=Methylobacillus flagellatus TaxID=405 RepID=UPI002853BBA2|nr:EAL domain-containing protein [Methylobacillus flagellatus]MDR5170891.1 EAL domain-containing protein [Methylobacillus flagellatus]